MQLQNIIDAFGKDERLTPAELLKRMSIEPTHSNKMRLAANLHMKANIKTRNARKDGLMKRIYCLGDFCQVMHTGKPFVPFDGSSYETMRLQLKGTQAKVKLLEAEVKKWRSLAHALARLRLLLKELP